MTITIDDARRALLQLLSAVYGGENVFTHADDPDGAIDVRAGLVEWDYPAAPTAVRRFVLVPQIGALRRRYTIETVDGRQPFGGEPRTARDLVAYVSFALGVLRVGQRAAGAPYRTAAAPILTGDLATNEPRGIPDGAFGALVGDRSAVVANGPVMLFETQRGRRCYHCRQEIALDARVVPSPFGHSHYDCQNVED